MREVYKKDKIEKKGDYPQDWDGGDSEINVYKIWRTIMWSSVTTKQVKIDQEKDRHKVKHIKDNNKYSSVY